MTTIQSIHDEMAKSLEPAIAIAERTIRVYKDQIRILEAFVMSAHKAKARELVTGFADMTTANLLSKPIEPVEDEDLLALPALFKRSGSL